MQGGDYEKSRLYYYTNDRILAGSRGLFFAQSVQAKVVSGSCGGETKYRYDSKSKKLELYGRGVVSQTIRVDEQLSRKNRYFQVKKLVIRQGITAIKDSSVLQYASEEERGISDDYELGWGFDVWRGLGDATEKLYVELPEGFTTITANMFGDIQVREIYIPASVTKIEEGHLGHRFILQVFESLLTTQSTDRKMVFYIIRK